MQPGVLVAVLIGALLVADGPTFAQGIAPQADAAVSAAYALEAAIDTADLDHGGQLFTADSRISDGALYSGADQSREWLRELAADGAWMDIVEAPEVSESSGEPLPGYWALASVTLSRHSFQDLGVAAMPATLAIIVQGRQIAYVSLRPDILWVREYQSARVRRVRPPVPSP